MVAGEWKRNVMLIGVAVGAIAGLGASYLLIRTAEENGGETPHISTADILKAGLGVVGVVRGIAALGGR